MSRLTESQRSIIAGKLAKLKVGDNQHSKEGGQICPPTLEQAADMLNVGTVRDALAKVEAMPELPKLGEIGNGRGRGDNVTSNDRGNATEYTLRRLKRDAPELLEAVKRGELSVNAAAIQAGIRKRLQLSALSRKAGLSAMPELPDVGPLTQEEKANGYIITNSSERGTGTEYTLRRLKRDAPEMLEAIKRGELSVNAAAIQAGIRKKPSPEERLQPPHVCDQGATVRGVIALPPSCSPPRLRPGSNALVMINHALAVAAPRVCDQPAPDSTAAVLPHCSRRCDPGEVRGVGDDVFDKPPRSVFVPSVERGRCWQRWRSSQAEKEMVTRCYHCPTSASPRCNPPDGRWKPSWMRIVFAKPITMRGRVNCPIDWVTIRVSDVRGWGG